MADDKPEWHISRDKPSRLQVLCGVPIVPGVAVMRLSEWEAQLDPWLPWGAPVCDSCARLAATLMLP